MPDLSERGRHRRPRPASVSRTTLTVTAGSAGLALPLLTASGATAAPVPAPAEGHHGAPAPRTDAGTQTVRAAVITLPAKSKPDKRVTHYTVRAGDTLSAIADAHEVRGGWPALYERNRQVIGADPDLIIPGQRLKLHGQRAAAPPAKESGKPKSAAKPRTKDSGKKDSGKKSSGSHTDSGKKASHTDSGKKTRTTTGWTTPLSGAHTGTGYGVSGSSWASGHHTGVDFPVGVGTGVRAVSGGTVVSAGWGGSYGYQVVIRHGDGHYSQYAHLSALTVRGGQHVNAGQRIGRSGSTGNTTGPHLHFEIRTGPDYGSDIDPLRYLRSKGVRV
ncbi:hypothetical protein SRB5_05880 [Streptomyces sp. RB5]|uniref:LysM domain-containing protein n=1 Tax=Streptomyces smaragdinus TaxID=2585196 RepID=A0A7K0CAK1_9ACTN|nr:M23 family metallopeptidase [Streptomyces smaragdinus]MQY10480.1 hypothetical protein [Streptomyces smaragdinus]